MARISTYTKDGTLTEGDKLLGTDAANKGRTVNITIGDIKTFMENNAEFNSDTTIFSQNTASDVWSITHNLEKFPSVYSKDSANNVIIGEVEHTNNNTLTITFSASSTGTAYLN